MLPEELRHLLLVVLAVASSLLVGNALLLLALRAARASAQRSLERSLRRASPILTAFENGEADEVDALRILRALPRAHAARLLRRDARLVSGESLERLHNLYAALGQPARDRAHLRARRFWLRLDALEGMSYFAFEGPLRELELLLTDPRESVRVGASRALARIGTAPALRLALSVLGGVSRLGLIELVHTMNVHGPIAMPLLAELLSSTPSAKVRAQGADVAWQVPASELLPVLLRFVATDDVELVTRTTRALSAFSDERALLTLRKLLAHEAWQVRAQAAKGLGALRDRDSALQLLRTMSDSSWWVRYNSAMALKRMGPVGEGRLRRVRSGDDRYASEMAERILRLETEGRP